MRLRSWTLAGLAVLLVAAAFLGVACGEESGAGSGGAETQAQDEFGPPIDEFSPTEPGLDETTAQSGPPGSAASGTTRTEETDEEEEEEDIAAVGEIVFCGDLPPAAFEITAGTILCNEALRIAGKADESRDGAYKFRGFSCASQLDEQTGEPVIGCLRDSDDAFVFFNFAQ